MKEYLIRFNQGSSTGFIENKKTQAEAGIFYTQVEGVHLIEDMVNNKAMGIDNALDLIHNITDSKLPLMTKINMDPLKAQLVTLAYMYFIRGKMERKNTDLQFQGKTALSICERCGSHGYIYYNGAKTEEVNSKMEAIQITERLYKEKAINLIEKESLEEQIEKSKLPDVNLEYLSHYN